MNNKWKKLNSFNSTKPLVQGAKLIEEVFKIYVKVELQRIESLIKSVNQNCKE